MTPQVLVVDDEPLIRETIQEILVLEGYSVATAADGQEALDLVMREGVDLVLLDIHLPVLDGPGFVAALRQRKLVVTIVVVTAAVDVRDWARQVDADGWLGKPFELSDLLNTVGRFVGPSSKPWTGLAR